jgi:hypothetical protein
MSLVHKVCAEEDLELSRCCRLAHRFGNAADNSSRQRRYPSDMTDAQ